MESRKPGRPPDGRKTAKRRAEILKAAASFFARRGYRCVRVDSIAESIGISKGTIYLYFPSKRELFLAAVDMGMQRLKGRIDSAGGEKALDRFARAIRAYLAFFDKNPEFVELFIQERAEFKDREKPTYFQHYEANIGPWRELFVELVAKGEIRDIPVERILDVSNDLLYGTIFTNHFAGRRKSFENQAQDLIDILFHGILRREENL